MNIEFGRFIPDLIKRRFPVRAKTFDDFIDLLKEEHASTVEAIPTIRNYGIKDRLLQMDPMGGYIRRRAFGAQFEAQNERGRRLLYKERYVVCDINSFAPLMRVSGAVDESEAVMRTLLTMRDRLNEIRDQVPQMEAHMKKRNGDKFTLDEYATMAGIAKKDHISAWNLEPKAQVA